MEVFWLNLNDHFCFEPMSACIGYFDGLHIGHMKLVSEMIFEANNKNLKKAIITFHPDPWVVIKKATNVPHLTSMEERIELAKQCDIDYFIILPFTNELAQMNPLEFEKMLKELNVQSLICGFDFTYGYKGHGNVESLRKQNNFHVIEVEPITYLNEKISSTRIENELAQGNVHEMIHLLGRNYSIQGTVGNGSKLGNTIGFPTANLKLTYQSILPSQGVYVGYAIIKDEKYRCMMNLGHNPTFNYQDQVSIETFIADFNENIYGQTMTLEFVRRIRDEKKFESKEALITQLKQDLQEVFKLES